MAWAASGGNTVTWTGTTTGDWSGLASTIITGTTNAASYVGTGGSGATNAKIIQLNAAVTSVVINGTFDDSDWTVYFPNNCKISFGANCIWTSGKDISGFDEGGSDLIFTNTGLSWGAANNITPGALIKWYGSLIYFAGAGFGLLKDTTTNASAQTHILKNVKITCGQTQYGWCIIDLKTSADSYIIGAKVNFTAGSLSAYIPTTGGWYNAGGPSFLPLSGVISSTNFYNLNANLNTGELLSLGNHGGSTQTTTYNLYNPVLDKSNIKMASNAIAQSKTERNIYCSGTLKVTDPLGSAISGSNAVITNTRTSATTLSATTDSTGSVSIPYTRVQYGIWTNGSSAVDISTTTPVYTDDSSQKIIVRSADRQEASKTYTWTGAALSPQLVQSTDSNFTGTVSQASAIAGIAFSVTGSAVAVSVTSNVTTQQIYNYWKWWTSQTAQMTGATPVSQSLITISSSVLNITGSITTSAQIAGASNATYGITASGTATTTGSGSYSGLYVNDSTGGTKLVQGVSNMYVEVKDNLSNAIVTYALASGDFYHRTVTGRTYTIKARQLGYLVYQAAYDATTASFSVSLTRDTTLLPIGTSQTVATLRTQADALTGYSVDSSGNAVFKSGGNLSDAYLSFSRQQEQSLTLTTPTFNGTTMGVTGNGAMASGDTIGLTGSGTLNIAGTWSGTIGTVPINDSTGGTKFVTGVSDAYVEIKDNLGNLVTSFGLQSGNLSLRTATGRTYSIKVRRMGYSAYASTYDASTGSFSVNLDRDKVLWPLDSAQTVAQLRTAADALTGYVLASNGDLTFPASGTLPNAYLSFSRQVEQDLTKTIPAYNGVTMNGVGNGSMTSGSLTGSGSLVIAGTWAGAIGTVSVQDSSGTRIIISAAEGNLSSYVILADSSGNYASAMPLGTSDDLGWVANATNRTIVVPANKTAYVYSIVYGYRPKVTWIGTLANTQLTHIPESFVNTSLDTTTRDAIVGKLASGLDATGSIVVTVSQTLGTYAPDAVLNALHRFMFVSGGNFGALSTVGKSAAGVALKADGVQVYTQAFYGQPAATLTPADIPDGGITIPLNFENLTGNASYSVLRKNANNVPLTGAPWVRAEASVGNDTQNAIASKTLSQVEASTVIAKKSQLTVINNGVQNASLLIPHAASI